MANFSKTQEPSADAPATSKRSQESDLSPSSRPHLPPGLVSPLAREDIRNEAYLDLLRAIDDVHTRLLLSPSAPADNDPFSARRTFQRHFASTSATVGIANGYLALQAGVGNDITKLLSDTQSRIEAETSRALDETNSPAVLKQRIDRALNGLSEEVISGARRGFCGWLGEENRTESLKEVLSKCHSLNELVHVIHTFATQNEEILEGLKRWGVTPNREGECIGVGVATPFSKEVFSAASALFTNLESPVLIVFGHEKGVHLMLRDYGHATTIDLTPDNAGNVDVHFQIPKVLDSRCLEALPGECFHDRDHRIAKGAFQVARADLPAALGQFIALLPTDSRPVPAGSFTVPWKF